MNVDDGDCTLDRFLGGRLTLRQPASGHRAGIDPLFLAASVAVRAGERVLDLGCGSGIAGLCLLARQPEAQVTGLELQPALVELARANALANGMDGNFQVIEGSASDPPRFIRGRGFDYVMTNPPWYEAKAVRAPADLSRSAAHVEGDGIDLGEWIKAAAGMLRPKGRLALVHRADRLGDILAALAACRLGEVRVTPLWPKAETPARRVLVSARAGVKTPLEIRPGLVLHRPDGAYTEAAEAVLRDGSALSSA